ncbi:MAG TPA: FGGY family carbohydrate kinase [Streptosporangiaceae bacterium]|nr:FGGY family carbohydrate kinase [Streptosporangiaceae bacterium]
MGPEHVVAIDIGTQSTRAALVDPDGVIRDVAGAPIDLFAPAAGWAEQDPEQWWQTTADNVAALMERNPGITIAAVGVGAQMHSLVAVDVAGNSLTPRSAIWSDKRCLDQVRAFARRPDAGQLSRVAGNRPLPAWAGFKMSWLRANAAAAYDDAASLLVAKDFLNLRLSGVAATDPAEASGTFLCDAVTGQWSADLLAALGVTRSKLPDIAGSGTVIGAVREEAARRTGLLAGTPVVAGSGDMMCQLLGSGITAAGQVAIVTGTASIVAAAAECASPDARVMNLRSASGNWMHFGISDAAGTSMRWFADHLSGLGPLRDPDQAGAAYDALTAEAAQVSAGSDGLLFFPYLLGERTLGSGQSRASFIGATLGHRRAHFTRAVLEGITFEDRRALESVCPGGPQGSVRCTGGGAGSAVWNQIRADIFGHPVQTLASGEGGILGASILAGVGAGWYPDAAAGARRVVRPSATWAPAAETAAVYDRAFRTFCTAHDALQDLWPRWGGGYGRDGGPGP